jgi:glycine oxidase
MTNRPGAPRDAIIVGGGIAGCLTAYLLSKEGLKVTVLEADSVGSHASGFAFGEMGDLEGAGIPHPLLEFSLWCSNRHRTLAQELKEVSGVDNQFQTIRRLTLALDQGSVAHLKENLEWQRKVKAYHPQWLEPDEILKIEPRVNPRCLGGMYIENACSVEPYRYTLAAAQSAERMGVEIVQRRVSGLLTEGDRCWGVTVGEGTEQRRMEADVVVLAMGPWTGLASQWCRVDIPVIPLKGQMLRLQHRGEPLRVSLHYGHSYASSKPDGLIWAGTTEERVGFNEDTTADARDKIMSELLSIAPFLSEAALVRQTACLRPWSADGMPVVGPVPGWRNLYVGTGGGRKGILWSTGMCYGLSDLILRGRTHVPGMAHLDIARFQRE